MKLADASRWNKVGTDHALHEHVAEPSGIFKVRLIVILRLCLLGMSKRDAAGFFKDIEHGNLVFLGRFHADVNAVIFAQPFASP